MNLFSVALILFLIMDPIGNISSYLSLVKTLPPARQRWVLLREMLIALSAILLFNFVGEFIFHVLELNDVTLQMAAGVILFFTACKILFVTKDNPRANLPVGEPFVIPLAIPLIAGPSLLATVMLYAHLEPSIPLMLGSIFAAWGAATLVLFFANQIKKILGNNGLIACERIMGIVLILLAIQRIGEGIQLFVKGL